MSARKLSSALASMRMTPNRLATRSAADLAKARPPLDGSVKRLVLPLSGIRPASVQPIVPLRSATTLFGRPALISDCAPMMLRVRPAQLTTTRVSGEGAMSWMRRTSSAPGTLVAPGIETRWNSSNGRLSTTTMSVPLRIRPSSSSAETLGVWQACSMCSPNALLGTLMPENSSRPAFSQAAMPPRR